MKPLVVIVTISELTNFNDEFFNGFKTPLQTDPSDIFVSLVLLNPALRDEEVEPVIVGCDVCKASINHEPNLRNVIFNVIFLSHVQEILN